MHTLCSITLMHNRYLSASKAKLSHVEAFHWYQAIAMSKNRLSASGHSSSELDSFWVTAALIGPISFYLLEAQKPEDAWPLNPPSPLDLSWIKIGT